MKLKTIAFIAVLTAISLTSCKNSPATENSVAESSVEGQSIIVSSIAEITQPEESSTVSETSIEEISEDDFWGTSKTTSSIEDESSLIMEITEYEYEENELRGGIEIIKYNGADTSIVIPNQIDGKEVTAIGESAFEENGNIVSVTIPNTVIDIKTNAFAQCSNLLTVTFEDNSKLDGIFTGAFEKTAIQEFTVPENCRYVSASFDMNYDMKKFVVLGMQTDVLSLNVPSECTIYFNKGSEAEKNVKLHSPFKWAYLDELE